MKWPTCIVTLIDMAGVTDIMLLGDSRASALMRRFHRVVQNHVNVSMRVHESAYCWNDSVLLHADVNGDTHLLTQVMIEAEALKRAVDEIRKCYAISVMGQAFPPPVDDVRRSSSDARTGNPRFTYIKASSYAFTNCHRVQEQLKGREADWYIDRRIVDNIPQLSSNVKHGFVKMDPSRKKRRIYIYKGDLGLVL